MNFYILFCDRGPLKQNVIILWCNLLNVLPTSAELWFEEDIGWGGLGRGQVGRGWGLLASVAVIALVRGFPLTLVIQPHPAV